MYFLFRLKWSVSFRPSNDVFLFVILFTVPLCLYRISPFVLGKHHLLHVSTLFFYSFLLQVFYSRLTIRFLRTWKKTLVKTSFSLPFNDDKYHSLPLLVSNVPIFPLLSELQGNPLFLEVTSHWLHNTSNSLFLLLEFYGGVKVHNHSLLSQIILDSNSWGCFF